MKSSLWDLQDTLSSSCHEAKRRIWIFPSHKPQCASCHAHWWEMADVCVCVTVSLLVLLRAFHWQLKGPVGLCISIPACPASPLPVWEVFNFQKLEQGAEIKKSARVGVRSGKYHFSGHLNKQIFVRVTPVHGVVVSLLNQRAVPPKAGRGHLGSLVLLVAYEIKTCTQNCAHN